MREICEMTAYALRREMLERRLGAAELVGYYLDRVARRDGPYGLNSIAELDTSAMSQARALDGLRERSDLPLFGLPILLKDNIDVAGLRTTAGSTALADNLAAADAPLTARLRKNGAVILGKTNMTEFANYTTRGMPAGYSSMGGQVLNAYGRDKDPSGSSTGSAVAVSAGFCAAAVGTDTSFSVVGCAASNGVAGLKPPVGVLPSEGVVPIARTLDSAGPLTRDFSDALLLYAAMRGEPMRVSPKAPCELRLAVNTFNRADVSDRQLERYESLFAALREDGAVFSEVSHGYTPYQKDVMLCEFMSGLEDYLRTSSAKRRTLAEIVSFYEDHPDRMPYGISHLRSALTEAPGKLADGTYSRALDERRALRLRMLGELVGYDACIMTGPTNAMHFAGLPSLALPLCMAEDGTPRGLIMYGSDETRLYSAALTVEKYCPRVVPPKL